MILTKVLSGAAIILGIYLVGIHLLFRKAIPIQQQTYHLGCFLVNDRPQNTSAQIVNEIRQIQQQAASKLKLNMYNSNAMDSQFQIKSIQLSKKFDQYLDALMANKLKQNNQVKFFRAVRVASKQLEDCKKTFTLNQTECIQNWKAYQGCTGRLQNLKISLLQLMEKKKKNMFQVNSLLDYNYKNDFKKNKTNQVDVKYKKLIDEVDQKQKLKQKEYQILKQQNQTESYTLNIMTNDLNSITASYKDCKEHRLQYRRCEEITKEVQNLGYGSIDTLQKRIDQKGQTLSKLKLMLDKSDNSASYKSLEELWKKGIIEYKQLLKLFIETKAKINIQCGCSQQKQVELKSEYERIKRLVQIKLGEMKVLQKSLDELSKDLEDLQNERQNLWTKYQKEVSQLTRVDINKIDTEGILLKAQLQLNRTNNNIQGRERQINQLQFLCNQYKDNMNRRLAQINNANNCLFKKEYLISMRRYGSMNSKNDESQNQKDLRNQLRSFLNSYKNQQDQETQKSTHNNHEAADQLDKKVQKMMKQKLQNSKTEKEAQL